MTGSWIVSLDISVGTLLLHTHNRLLTRDANGSTSAHTSAWSACYRPSRGAH